MIGSIQSNSILQTNTQVQQPLSDNQQSLISNQNAQYIGTADTAFRLDVFL